MPSAELEPRLPSTAEERFQRWHALLRAKDKQIAEITTAAEEAYTELLQGNADTALAVLAAALPQARQHRKR
jgi:hypothetical protein